MTAFDAARFNFYWYLWLLSPILFGVFAAFVETRLLRVVLFTSSMLAVYAFSNLAVWRKWEPRLAGATSPDEVAAATADGGNLVFTLILGLMGQEFPGPDLTQCP